MRVRFNWRCLVLAFSLLSACTSSSSAYEPHAVILLYHHVSEQTPASTSVTPAQFERHLDYLAENDYRVWPLARALDAVLRGAEEIPDRVVAITFDDAYDSVHSRAHPSLVERNWPYTVFVNTNAVDAGHSPYMSWDQLRDLADQGAAIENHSAAHGHMSRPRAGESERDWRERVRADISTAGSRIEDEIGRAPVLFAYPYGEDAPELAKVVAKDHEYGLAQRSGPVGPLTDPLSIPRFPMATGFASLDRLELALRSRPLPVSQTRAREVKPGDSGNIDRLELRVEPGGFRAGQLSCFAGNGQRLETGTDGDGPFRLTIDVAGVGTPGRNKVNCTAPAADGSGDFYWYSHQWLVVDPA
ncbi:MAG: polysaccharide deacetylase family protein [Wenzhouxiangellaceae bacterium]